MPFNFKTLRTTIILLTAFFITSCGGDSTSPHQPVADAGPDQVVITGDTINLSGGNSYDPEDKTLTYTWSLESKPETSLATLSDGTTEAISITLDVEGPYLFKLVVNNGEFNSAADYVSVKTQTHDECITDSVCGVDEFCKKRDEDCSGVGSCAERPLDCDASDQPVCGCNNKTYANLCEANAAGKNIYYISGCIVADAGVDQTAEINEALSLSGEQSYDPDGDPLTYLWTVYSQVSGSSVSLNNTTDSIANFSADKAGNYLVSLAVTDGTYSSTDLVTVNILPKSCTINAECGVDEFCRKPLGDCAGGGRCMSMAGVYCFANWDPVCGCNGQTYSNECTGWLDHVNAESAGVCPSP